MSEQSPAVSNREEGDPPATAVATASGEPEQGAFQSTADDDEQSSARPTDEQILAHEYNVRVEEAKKVELIGSLEPLSSLAAEYRQGSQVVVAKIERLERQYRSLRRARGDGNCFFRSAIFSYLEGLICANDVEERDRVVECLGGWESKMEEAGFQKLVFEDALTLLTELVQSIGSVVDPLPLEVLELKMRSEEVSNYIVMFVRFLTSASIRRSQEFFAPFILGLSDLDVDDFCRTQVEPMGEESDHVQIVALSQALQLPIRVVYLDNSGSLAALQASTDPAAAAAAASGTNSPEATYHDFLPDGFSGSPRVHLLYRPGHYDILYPR